ncbi:HET-domain-containing protein [Nemania sp. FL0916]|nr:HET-domain-containing protein [Nemania sp. FL0916]
MSTGDLCHFCKSTDWEQLLTGVFNPKRVRQEMGQYKHAEYNLGIIRSNEATCDLCRLISHASRALKPWWPIAEFLDQPERITCAFFNGRNRLGSGILTSRISQTQMLLDQVSAQTNPNFSSSNLLAQRVLDTLDEQGITLDGTNLKFGEPRKSNSLHRLVVLAGITSVPATAQTFMQLHPCLYPIPKVEDYANGTNPSLEFPTGRIVQPEVNVQLLRKWYDICLHEHGEACEQPSWLGPGRAWPRILRLLDVMQHCLVDAPNACPYFALSYVWGSEQHPFQSTSQNLSSLYSPNALDSHTLPKTIRDAMWLTREMGVKYLWVDRLCVVQDSDADKAIQLPQMDLVYSSAALTIMATSGTAKDGLAGINNTPRKIDQGIARVAENFSVMNVLRLDQAYETCPWRTRGWTFQEGLCSRRSLVITSDQVFWSCDSAKYCEAIAFEDFPTAVNPGDLIFHVLSGHRVFGEFGGANFTYRELQSMVAAYNKRYLSVQGDVLNAFTGVLNRVSQGSGHEFYWGHSASCMFALSLAWVNIVWGYDADVKKMNTVKRRRATHRVLADDGTTGYDVPIPSWSWLGWMHLEGLGRCIPKQVNVVPELDIMKLDVNGRAAPLNPSGKKLEDLHEVKMDGIDTSTSLGWKQETAIPTERLLAPGDEFRDSGRLIFWTSHAELETRDGKIYSSSSSTTTTDADGEKEKDKAAEKEIGELLPMWYHQVAQPRGKFSFIVISRTLDDFRYNYVRAEKKLYLLLVEWVDREKCMAERICAAQIDESAWVSEKREWILVTLA